MPHPADHGEVVSSCKITVSTCKVNLDDSQVKVESGLSYKPDGVVENEVTVIIG